MMNVKIKVMLSMAIFLLLSCFNFAKAEVIDKIIAVVNSDVITKSELDKKTLELRQQLEFSRASIPSETKLRKDALDILIDVLLQMQLARRIGLKFDDNEVNKIISNIAKNNNLTVEQLKIDVPRREGISFNEFKEKIRTQGLITRVQQQALSREIVVNKKDINKVLRNPPKMESVPARYHIIDILFAEPKEDSQVKMDVITNVVKKMVLKLKKLNNVEKIELFKKEAEQDLKEQVIVSSEDLGWRKLEEYPDIFIKYIKKMKKGEAVGPIEAPNGLHLLKLVDFNKGFSAKELTKEQAADIAFQQKLMKKVKPWLKELRSKAYIKIINK